LFIKYKKEHPNAISAQNLKEKTNLYSSHIKKNPNLCYYWMGFKEKVTWSGGI